MTKRPDPFAVLAEGRRSHPVASILAAIAVLVVFVALLAYVAASGDDDQLPRAPGGNAPHQP